MIKRDVYIGDFVTEIHKRQLGHEFEMWHETAHPEFTNAYLLLEQIIDTYPGGRSDALDALRAGKKIWLDAKID